MDAEDKLMCSLLGEHGEQLKHNGDGRCSINLKSLLTPPSMRSVSSESNRQP
jgi:hypothetical protein